MTGEELVITTGNAGVAAIRVGIPDTVPAVTVKRVCPFSG
jgi:acetyl-CoA acetyltransferase